MTYRLHKYGIHLLGGNFKFNIFSKRFESDNRNYSEEKQKYEGVSNQEESVRETQNEKITIRSNNKKAMIRQTIQLQPCYKRCFNLNCFLIKLVHINQEKEI